MTQEKYDTVRATGEYVIIKSIAHPANSEIYSQGGMLLGYRELPEVPKSGVIVDVGSDVPEETRKILLNARVVLPTQHMTSVPDPELISGEITEEEARKKITKFSTCHYKAVQAVYGKQ
ncbi:chaperone protein [Pantoea phage Phynn]|nr:chaperone protein [Pantoea phage Phynn]